MAVEPVPNYPQLTSGDLDEIESIAEAYTEGDRKFQQTSSSHTVGRSAYTSGHPFTSSDRPLKRQRVDSPLPRDMHIDVPSSRDAMPPPSKPLSRMRSVRGLIPTIRKKFMNSRPLAKDHQKNNGNVQVFDNGHWRDAADSNIDGDQSSYLPQDLRSDTPYMSGALPVVQMSKGSPQLASVGAHGNASEFSFRTSSPGKMNDGQGRNPPIQLPSGPSYLRFMDDLSSNNGLELGLRDPRKSAPSRYETSNDVRPPVSTLHNQHQVQESSSQQRWGFGHAFLHQSPNAPPNLTNNQCTPPIGTSKGYFNRAQYEPPPAIATLAPTQLHQPARQVDTVVSPFFGRNHYDAPIPPQPRITETQTSSHRFGACRSQRHPALQASTEWREAPSLDRLSFINTPLDSRNERIMRKRYRRPSDYIFSENYNARTLNSHGLVMRPNDRLTSFVDDIGSDPSINVRPTFSRRQRVQQQSIIPPSSFSRAPLSQTGRLPSSMPSIVSNHPPVRNRTQWEMLQHAGVRSSRQTSRNVRGNTFNAALSSSFSRVEGRSVKR
jgi:hypothetical protein